MERIWGKQSLEMDPTALAARVASYREVLIDLGTGDGRYVRHMTTTCPTRFGIGVDACRENLRDASRRAPENALYLIANALALPEELAGLATQITINFPWGSLLYGLLQDDPALLCGLHAISRPGSTLEVRLNAGALAEVGWELESGAARVQAVLRDAGFQVAQVTALNAAALRCCPTSWAKQLAFGRDPRGLQLRATRAAGQLLMCAATDQDSAQLARCGSSDS